MADHRAILTSVIEELESIKPGAAAQALSSGTRLWGNRTGEVELSLDSLDLLELFVRLEARLGLQVPDEFDLATCATVGDVVRLLASRPLIR